MRDPSAGSMRDQPTKGCARGGAILTTVVLAFGCGGEPRCRGPSQEITPARSVSAPKLTLAGMTLDMTSVEARRSCEAMLGAYREPAYCRPPSANSLVSDELARLHAVDVGIDTFGHVKQIKGVYVGEAGELAAQQRRAVQRVDEVLGQARSGGLPWCERQAGSVCRDYEYAEWQFEGGTVVLESDVDSSTMELELTYRHDDMNERVVYGLLTCG